MCYVYVYCHYYLLCDYLLLPAENLTYIGNNLHGIMCVKMLYALALLKWPLRCV
jgi:proline dehydrogenase